MDRPRRRPDSERRVTLNDVARYAGVSVAVVSYVVNDGPRPVAEATAARVREAIRVLGYRPNSHARALSTGRAGMVGLIVPSTANPFFGEYNDALAQAAAAAGTALLSAGSAGRADQERRLIDTLARRDVDAILVVSSMVPSDVALLHPTTVPIVFLNCAFPVPGHVSIGPDGKAGVQAGVRHLLEAHGHASVAMLAGETGSPDPDEREIGWRTAHELSRRAAGHLRKAPFTLKGGYEATTDLLMQTERPTAIFASSDLQAYGVLHALHDHDVRVPHDIAVVTFDGTAPTAHSWPPLTAVRQPQEAMAQAALDAVLTAPSPRHLLFPTELILRQSCGCHAPTAEREARGDRAAPK